MALVTTAQADPGEVADAIARLTWDGAISVRDGTVAYAASALHTATVVQHEERALRQM